MAFRHVKTKEGKYKVENNELTYFRTKDQPITSAEQMISNEGYDILLANLKTRLSTDDVDLIIELISKQK